MAKPINVQEETWKELSAIKIKHNFKSFDSLILFLIKNFKDIGDEKKEDANMDKYIEDLSEDDN
jgi:hypothetical protein